MSGLTEDQKKVRDLLRPPLTELVRVVNTVEGLRLTGFIFGFTPEIMMYFGNIEQDDTDLISLHLALTSMAVRTNMTGRAEIEELDPDADSTIEKPKPEALADKLASSVISVPIEMVPEPIRSLAIDYLAVRLKKDS